MSIQDPMAQSMSIPQDKGFMGGYLEALSLVERLHRLLLDVIKDEFERVGVLEINAVQAMLLFNIGDNEVTAGELKSLLKWAICTISDARLTVGRFG